MAAAEAMMAKSDGNAAFNAGWAQQGARVLVALSRGAVGGPVVVGNFQCTSSKYD